MLAGTALALVHVEVTALAGDPLQTNARKRTWLVDAGAQVEAGVAETLVF